jgi:hypothetical protein
MKRNSGSGVADRSDLEHLAMAAREADSSRRWTRLNSVLDMDRFLSFMAMEVLSGHRDGYCLARNNFRLYHDPTSDKFVFLPDGMDQLFGRADFPVQPQMAGVLAKVIMETPAGKRAYRDRLAILLTNCFKVGALTNRVREWSATLASNLTRAEARTLQREAAGFCERIQQRVVDVTRQLAIPEPTLLTFKNGFARLNEWHAVDPPAGGKLEQTADDERTALHIHAGPETRSSWRTMVWLEPGHYRFEGLVRIAGLKPLASGKKHGAFLSVWGKQVSGAQTLVSDTGWTKLQAEFEVSEREAKIELLCALRASAGDAWFDVDSLQLVRLESKSK